MSFRFFLFLYFSSSSFSTSSSLFFLSLSLSHSLFYRFWLNNVLSFSCFFLYPFYFLYKQRSNSKNKIKLLSVCVHARREDENKMYQLISIQKLEGKIFLLWSLFFFPGIAMALAPSSFFFPLFLAEASSWYLLFLPSKFFSKNFPPLWSVAFKLLKLRKCLFFY